MPVYRDKNGYYYFSVMISGQRTLRRRDLKGNRLKTKRQALAAEREFLMQYDKTPVDSIRFYELFEAWLIHRRKIWKESTCYHSEGRFRKHIKNVIPNLLIDKFTQKDFDTWREYVSKQNLDKTYKNYLVNAFKALWKYADDYHFCYLQYKYASRLLPIRETEYRKKKDKITYDLNQFVKLISNIQDIRVLIYICIGYLTGTRVSETLGIKIENYNYEKSTITINHQTTNSAGLGGMIDFTLKNDNSNRIIYLPKWINNLIKDFLDNIHPFASDPEAYLIYSSRSKKKRYTPISPTNLRLHIDEASSRAGLPQIDLRELRTSFATFASDLEGVELKTIAKAMGHTNISTTSRYYDQSGIKHLKSLADAIDKALENSMQVYQKCIKN